MDRLASVVWQGKVEPKLIREECDDRGEVRLRVVFQFADGHDGFPRIVAEAALPDAMGGDAWVEARGRSREIALQLAIAHMASLCVVATEAAKNLAAQPALEGDENVAALVEAATLTQGRATVGAAAA